MRNEGRGRRRAVALMLAVSLGVLTACDGLLEVNLPSQLTDDALQDPKGAETQVASAIALFECGYSAFTWVALGHEDVFESIAGVAGTVHRFRATPVTGECDQASEDQSWYDQIMGARTLSYGVYHRMQNVWTAAEVPDRERLSAIAALYTGLALTIAATALVHLDLAGVGIVIGFALALAVGVAIAATTALIGGWLAGGATAFADIINR